MNRDPIANARPMTDEQRKAMFARMGGGGGGGGGGQSAPQQPNRPDPETQSPWRPSSDTQGEKPQEQTQPAAAPATRRKPFTPEKVSKWALFKAAASGFLEGARGGASIVADKLTFGATDYIGVTDSDQYQGKDYDFSRGAATVAQTALTTAAGIGALDKLGKAFQATKLASTTIGKLSAPLTAIGGFGTKSAIDDYRAANPTLNPIADKALAAASQLAGFIGAAGAVGSIGKALGLVGKVPLSAKLGKGALDKLQKIFTSAKDPTGIGALQSLSAGGRATLATYAKSALGLADKGLGALERGLAGGIGKVSSKIIGKTATGGISKALKSLHSAYTKFSNFTGSTIKDAIAAPKAAGNLAKAKKASTQAAGLRRAAADLKTAEGIKEATFRAAAKTKLAEASAQTAAGNTAAAKKAYAEAVKHTWKADDIARAAAKAAKTMTDDAAILSADAAALAAQGRSGLAAAAYVAGISGAMTAVEEKGGGALGEKLGFGKGIAAYEAEAKAAFKAGKKFNLPADKERSDLATAAAITIGTTGNPVEKWTRSNWAKEQAEVGAYRAKYALIGEAAARGDITAAQAQKAYATLAAQKPKKMAGRGIWDVAPAAAAYLNWKVGDAMDKGKRSEISYRPEGTYIDGDTLHAADGRVIRLVDINAPEVAHPGHNDPDHPERTTGEYLGDKSAEYADRLLKARQYFRIVTDSNPEAGGETYGRKVASVETLPKPFDQLLRIPKLGKIIPAKEFQTKMIRAGMADIDYRELTKFKGDNLEAHDAARAEAQAAKRGIWSDEAKAAFDAYAKATPNFTPWVGTEKTKAQKRTEFYQKTHGGALPPDQPMNELGKTLGMGLMTTGNSGIFGMMPQSGSAIAQGWNGLLALLGGLGYNETARAAEIRSSTPMNAIPTDYARQIAALRREQAARIAALNAQ